MRAELDATVWFDNDGTATVSGSPEAFALLSRYLASDEEILIELSLSEEVPPDVMRASAIRLRQDGHPGLTASREGRELVLTGDPSAMGILRKNIAQLGDDTEVPGGHIHIEHFPDHPYIRSGSLPLIFTTR
jgi:hypothetical protein